MFKSRLHEEENKKDQGHPREAQINFSRGVKNGNLNTEYKTLRESAEVKIWITPQQECLEAAKLLIKVIQLQ